MKLTVVKETATKNPFKKEQAFFANYHKVEKLLMDYYGFKEYSIVAMEETSNDMSLVYDLNGKLFDFEKEDIDEALKTHIPKQYRTANYLKGLMNSVLEPGIYIIEICW
jgi:hypothetical protein